MAKESSGTVLVVDDEATIVEIVARYLERAGFETLEAKDGPEALHQADLHRPDLVVLDLMLPGLDGIEVMRRLHERPGKRVAVILLTARGEENDRLVGLRHGADDYVVKPFSPAELVARVRR
jgi:two-component system, OmpR family, response regulator ResD